MSEREMCLNIIDMLPEYKVKYVLAYLQGISVGEMDDFNEETKQAIEDAEAGIGLSRAFDSVDELMADLLKA